MGLLAVLHLWKPFGRGCVGEYGNERLFNLPMSHFRVAQDSILAIMKHCRHSKETVLVESWSTKGPDNKGE